MKVSEQQVLASKAIDFMLWKMIRVFNLSAEERRWYGYVNAKSDELLAEQQGTEVELFYIKHYLHCFFSLQLAQWDTPPPSLAQIQQKNIYEIDLNRPLDEEINVPRAMGWVLHSLQVRSFDASNVYRLFLALYAQVKQSDLAIPESAKVDFISTIYLTNDPLAPLYLLSIFIDYEWLNAQNKVFDKETESGQDVELAAIESEPLEVIYFVKLHLIEEFNQLARSEFQGSIIHRMHSPLITADKKELPPGMFIFAHQFSSKPAQQILCDVLNGKKISYPVLKLIDKIKGESLLSETECITLLSFALEEYEYKVFIDQNGKLCRIEKMINYLASYYIEYLKQVHNGEGDEDYSSIIYNDEGWDGKNKDLKTTSAFLQELLAQLGIKINSKKLWLTHKDMYRGEDQSFVANVLKSWNDYQQQSALLDSPWYERQYLTNFTPCHVGTLKTKH